MLNIDKQFIKQLKSNSNKNISFIDEVAHALEVNYDAAYRRINGKTTLSLKDAIKLSKHFNISLNNLYMIGDNSKILIKKHSELSNFKDLEKYYNNVLDNLKQFIKVEKAMMYYSAKELPVFHLLKDNELLKFKIYVWMQVVGNDNYSRQLPFKDFNIPQSLINVALKVGEQYENIKITELWSSNIINTALHQIKYFYESDLLSFNSAINICNELRNLIKNIEKTAFLGKRNNANKTSFKIFYNPILNSNNNILLKSPNKKILYMSYSVLKYYEIKDPTVCNSMEKFLKKQILLANQITNSGIKDINLFFKQLYKQIESLEKQIKLIEQFPLQKF